MSIQPPSDIILDVAQAADPAKSMAAAQRLMRAGDSTASGEAFSGVLGNISPGSNPLAALGSRLGSSGSSTNVSAPGPVDARVKAYQGLEALIFQNLFETTLPHDTSLGEGMAGDVFRSMLAEQLGKQMSKTIDLGIMPKAPSSHAAAVAREVLEPSAVDAASLFSSDPEASDRRS